MERVLSERVRVQVMGREYELDSAGLTDLEIYEIASVLDERMKDIRDRYGLADTQKIAVLAALNLAYESKLQKESGHSTGAETRKKLDRLNRLLEQTLQEE